MSCSPAESYGTCEAACACRAMRARHSSANSEVVSCTGTTAAAHHGQPTARLLDYARLVMSLIELQPPTTCRRSIEPNQPRISEESETFYQNNTECFIYSIFLKPSIILKACLSATFLAIVRAKDT